MISVLLQDTPKVAPKVSKKTDRGVYFFWKYLKGLTGLAFGTVADEEKAMAD
jgi:hypothetical protein